MLCFTDLTILPDQLFWHRDLGLLTKAFRELGHDAWLVVHPAGESTRHPPPATRHDPVIWASPSDVRNPSWWQSQKPDLVILGLWTRPKYDSIRRAALSATPRVIERADSDGMRTASCGLKIYARRRYDYFRDRTFGWPAFLSVPTSALYSLLSLAATPWVEARLARTLRIIPTVIVETPGAAHLWKQLARKLKAFPSRIHCLPHPVAVSVFRPTPCHRRLKKLLCVGRWESYQKNFHGLCRIVVAFLRSHPDWRAEFVGSGLGSRRAPKGVRFFSSCSAQALARKMQSSRILVYASFYESFLLAGAEALCCGARVVGPSGLVTTRFFEFLSGPYDQRTPKKCISLAEKLENAAGRKPLSPATVRLVRRKLNPTRIAKRLIAFGGGRSLRNTQAAPTKKKP